MPHQQYQCGIANQPQQPPRLADENRFLTRPDFVNLLQRVYEGSDDKISITRWANNYHTDVMRNGLDQFSIWICLNCENKSSSLKHELYNKWFGISQEAQNGGIRRHTATSPALRLLLYQSLLDHKSLRREIQVAQENNIQSSLDKATSAIVDRQDATSHFPHLSELRVAPEVALRKALIKVSEWIAHQCCTPPDSERKRQWYVKWALVAEQCASGMFNDTPVSALSILVYHCFLDAHAMMNPELDVVHSQLQSSASGCDISDQSGLYRAVDPYTDSGSAAAQGTQGGYGNALPLLDQICNTVAAADNSMYIDQFTQKGWGSGPQILPPQPEVRKDTLTQGNTSAYFSNTRQLPSQSQNLGPFPAPSDPYQPNPYQGRDLAEGHYITGAQNSGEQKMPAQLTYLTNVPMPFDLDTITMSMLHEPVTPRLRVPNKEVLDEQMISQPVLYRNFRLATEWILRHCERQGMPDALYKWQSFKSNVKGTWPASQLTLPMYSVLLDVYMLRANPA